jgi:hypothetical protein
VEPIFLILGSPIGRRVFIGQRDSSASNMWPIFG